MAASALSGPHQRPSVLTRDEEFSTQDPDRDGPAHSLQKWLDQLPAQVTAQIALARRHAVPFMPPDVTPEMLSAPNAMEPSMNQIQITCKCIDIAMSLNDYDTAAALIFVVDRAQYRFGQSKSLLRVVSEIHRLSPDTPIAPQVILRQARVMKDEGDLNGAMKILLSIVNKERKWAYQDDQQYEDTKAACLHVEGQIYHNLGLWREAVSPLVQAVRIFRHVQDKKGISSCLTVLSRCLPRLDPDDYQHIRRTYPDVFQSDHPFYEGYVQGMDAVRFVEHIEARFFAAKHQLVADESLLMFAALQHDVNLQCRYLRTILDEVKRSLAGHRAVQNLNSVEAFVEFVRGVFMVSLVLSYSGFREDRDGSRYFEKLSMELYHFMVSRPGSEGDNEPSGSLKQTVYSVSLVNQALALLGLPQLEGTGKFQMKEASLDPRNIPEKERNRAPEVSSANITQPHLTGEGNTQQTGPEGPKDPDESKPSCSSSESAVHLSQRDVQPLTPQGNDLSPKGRTPTSKHPNPLQQKAGTFPAASPRRLGRQNNSDAIAGTDAGPKTFGSLGKKWVGLPMTLEELRASTCPALSFEARNMLSKEEEVHDQLEINDKELEALTVSSKTFSSSSGFGTNSDLSADWDVISKFQSSNDRKVSEKEQAESRLHPEVIDTNGLNVADTIKKIIITDGIISAELNNAESQLSSGEIKDGASEATASSWQNLDDIEVPDGHLSCKGAASEDTEHSKSDSHREPTEAESEVSTVDLNKSTVSSGPSFSNSSSFSLVDLNATTKSSTPNSSGSSASPLMDHSSSASAGLMQDLNLGQCCVETKDLQEFLANWTPSADNSVLRAVLKTFNPETGKWSPQHTLAHVGPKLQTGKKGAFRDAFHINILHQDEPLGRYVGKRYRKQKEPKNYHNDVMCQMTARNYVTKFNQRLTKAPEDFPRAQFLPASYLQFENERGEALDWLNVEPYLHGCFLKLTNNQRFVSKNDELQGEVEVATAFTHFSYVETQGQLMVVDLQGWVPSAGGGVIYLTDPVLHTACGHRISSCDRQLEGMREFWRHVHPQCNRICKYLGLHEKRPACDGV